MKDKYARNMFDSIKKAVTDEEIYNIINKIYEDGIIDGIKERTIKTEE